MNKRDSGPAVDAGIKQSLMYAARCEAQRGSLPDGDKDAHVLIVALLIAGGGDCRAKR